jgi:nucleotide-binding universal stress UspA family protein
VRRSRRACSAAGRNTLSGAAGRLRQAGFEGTEHWAAGELEAAIAKVLAEQDVDLLVVGKSGNSRLRGLFIGSRTLDLMRTCAVPVLIFP